RRGSPGRCSPSTADTHCGGGQTSNTGLEPCTATRPWRGESPLRQVNSRNFSARQVGRGNENAQHLSNGSTTCYTMVRRRPIRLQGLVSSLSAVARGPEDPGWGRGKTVTNER